jgi:hypothetical protein
MNQMAKKNRAAVALGRKGGKNSRIYLSPAERTRLAKKAANARWNNNQSESKGARKP